MTDLQDEICDALVGNPIGRTWANGPLRIAADVVNPAAAARRRVDLGHALGWPTLFCDAVTGANSALLNENDRRDFAITLFANVPLPRPGSVARSRPGCNIAAATWAATRVHPLACSDDCPLLTAVRSLLDPPPPPASASGRAWELLSRLFAPRRVVCATATVAGVEARVALVEVYDALRMPAARRHLKSAFYLAPCAEARLRGTAGAVGQCLGLAAKLRLVPGREAGL